MSICPRCGRVYDEDAGFCPYCHVPLVRKRRGYIHRTIGGPGGFRASEVPEYLARKMRALIMCVFGSLMCFVGFSMWLFSAGENAGGLILLFIGLPIALYGYHLWEKITFLMWTRQALREYGVPSIFDFFKEKISEFRRGLSFDHEIISDFTYGLKEDDTRDELLDVYHHENENVINIPISYLLLTRRDDAISFNKRYNNGTLRLYQEKIIFTSNGGVIEIDLDDVKIIKKLGINPPKGIVIIDNANNEYTLCFDAKKYEQYSLIRLIKQHLKKINREELLDSNFKDLL